MVVAALASNSYAVVTVLAYKTCAVPVQLSPILASYWEYILIRQFAPYTYLYIHRILLCLLPLHTVAAAFALLLPLLRMLLLTVDAPLQIRFVLVMCPSADLKILAKLFLI